MEVRDCLAGKLNNIIFLLIIGSISLSAWGQDVKYSQFWSEMQFARTISEKWSAEFDFANSFSSSESSGGMFANNMQKSFRLWANYYLAPRWKLSAFAAYYDNHDVPEIGQYKSPEMRFALQGTYYFHKIGYTLSARSRVELRHMRNRDSVFENVFRFRQQIKYVQPINGRMLRKGVLYAVFSDEIFLKSGAKVTGESFFDRNRLNLGAGYLFSDDIQAEASYANEYLPRKSGNQTVNAVSITITFNNLFDTVKDEIFNRKWKKSPKKYDE